MNTQPIRLAVWSGPRNISTALMRSWGARADTAVIDEPFYAYYLKQTGVDHPGADEVIRCHETDWRKVIETLLGPVPGGKRIFYQKHMNKHMLADIDMGWIEKVTHCFLIRDPEEMITSYIKVAPNPTIDDFGLVEQAEMFERLRESAGAVPIVVDARDVLENPRRVLGLWCGALGIGFDEAMLRWNPGIHPTDGVWAKHWYGNVIRSETFQPYKPKNERVPPGLGGLLDECRKWYGMLYKHRLH